MCSAGDVHVTLQSRFDADGAERAAHEALPPEPMGNRPLGSEPSVFLYDAHPGGVGFAEEEVVTHGSGEEKGFLSDISEGLAKGALVEVTQRDAIERDDAALRIVEAGEELEERAFARTGVA
jgi:hypothetical protein